MYKQSDKRFGMSDKSIRVETTRIVYYKMREILYEQIRREKTGQD